MTQSLLQLVNIFRLTYSMDKKAIGFFCEFQVFDRCFYVLPLGKNQNQIWSKHTVMIPNMHLLLKQQAGKVWCASTVLTQGKHSPDFTKLYWPWIDHGWQRVLRMVTGSWSCVLVAPYLSGYKQSHLAATPVTLFPHQPLPSLSCNLCQLSRGGSMRVKTWQALSMSPLSSDQRGFIRSK